MSDKITCSICGAQVHSVQIHLKNEHSDWTIEKYKQEFPDAALLSEMAKKKVAEKVKEKDALITEMAGAATSVTTIGKFAKQPLHEVFNLGKVKAALNAKGEAIPISVAPVGGEFDDLIPEIDKAYIFSIDLLKTVLLGLDLNIPTYLWGHAGVGKSTILEQVCAFTNRPYMRIQHTINTEEVHIVGQMLANETGTYFEPGPLALAMKHGWTYNADEYDFAHPSVLAVYQAVLEGKSLLIKEAPGEWRSVKPHANFRFVATGNTNGSGDETGLYMGTQMGNAANYSRFGITEMVDYMPKKQEIGVVCNQSGIIKEDAEKLIEFAHAVRKSFDAGKMSSTVGPRELINAARVGLRRGSWRTGLNLAYINRLGRVDRETANGVAQRIFG